jgi:hypothetical protein
MCPIELKEEAKETSSLKTNNLILCNIKQSEIFFEKGTL